MKRRKFIVSAASATGLLWLSNALGARPCPPALDAASGSDVCDSENSSNSVLRTAADSLGPGDSVFQPIAPNPYSELWDISWQGRTAFYDEEHGEISYMGKGQNGGDARHFIYDESNDLWRIVESNLTPNDLGHIWIVSYDHTENPGDYFYGEHQISGAYFWKFDRSVENGRGEAASPWSRTSASTFDVWAGNSTPHPGILYHPNLLGQGQPGVFCLSAHAQMSIWDQSNDSWINIGKAGASGPYGVRSNTSTLYLPGLDIGVFGNGKDQSEETAVLIGASYRHGLSPPRVSIPFRISGGNGNNSAMMLLDPRDSTRSTVMLLERGSASEGGQGRVWTCADITAVETATDWKLEPFKHPFADRSFFNTGSITAGRWTACSIPRYGCILGLVSIRNDTQSSFESLLWRPGS